MIGTFINIAAVLFGGSIGMFFGARLPERVSETIVAGLGLFVLAIGLMLFLESSNVIIVLISLLLGGVLGEFARIEDRLAGLGAWLEGRFIKDETDSSDFVRGFLTASLLFCVGPITILGAIQDGLTGDFSLLAIKSVLDGFAALAFATTFGVSVLFSVVVILVYQGGLTLLASQAQTLFTEPMMLEMTAAGGVIMIGLAVSSLLELKKIRVGNFLPSLFVAPLIVFIIALF